MKSEGEDQDKATAEPESVSVQQKLTAIENGSTAEPAPTSLGVSSDATPPVVPSDKPWLGTPPKKSSKKKWIIGGLVAALLVVFGGGAAAYAFWYQAPEKVVLDAVSGAMAAKTVESSGTYVINSEGANIDGSFTLRGGYKEGYAADTKATLEGPENMKLKLDLAAVGAPNGDSYFKIAELRELYDSIIGAVVGQVTEGGSMSKDQQAQVQEYLDETFLPVINSLDNKWVKVAVNDYKKLDSKIGENYTCSQKVYETLAADDTKLKEIRDVYFANQFVKITQELGEKDGNVGYRIEHDDAKWKQFADAAKQTWVFKELEKCADGADLLGSDAEDVSIDKDTVTTFRIWVGKWDHKLKSAELNATTGKGEQQSKADIKADFKLDEAVKIEIPNDAKSIDDISPKVSSFLSA